MKVFKQSVLCLALTLSGASAFAADTASPADTSSVITPAPAAEAAGTGVAAAGGGAAGGTTVADDVCNPTRPAVAPIAAPVVAPVVKAVHHHPRPHAFKPKKRVHKGAICR